MSRMLVQVKRVSILDNNYSSQGGQSDELLLNIICAIATFFYFLPKAVISKQAEKGLKQCWVCEAFYRERMRRRHRCGGSWERHNVPPGTLHGPIPSSQSHIWVSRTFASPCAVASMHVPSSSLSWFFENNFYIQKQFLPKVVSLCAAQDDSGDGEGSAESSASGGLPLHRDHESLIWC